MAAYEIGDKSARIIYGALRAWQERRAIIGAADPMELDMLIRLFAPPEPPTAEELAEALQTWMNALTVISSTAEKSAVNAARDVLKRYDATRGVQP